MQGCGIVCPLELKKVPDFKKVPIENWQKNATLLGQIKIKIYAGLVQPQSLK